MEVLYSQHVDSSVLSPVDSVLQKQRPVNLDPWIKIHLLVARKRAAVSQN